MGKPRFEAPFLPALNASHMLVKAGEEASPHFKHDCLPDLHRIWGCGWGFSPSLSYTPHARSSQSSLMPSADLFCFGNSPTVWNSLAISAGCPSQKVRLSEHGTGLIRLRAEDGTGSRPRGYFPGPLRAPSRIKFVVLFLCIQNPLASEKGVF